MIGRALTAACLIALASTALVGAGDSFGAPSPLIPRLGAGGANCRIDSTEQIRFACYPPQRVRQAEAMVSFRTVDPRQAVPLPLKGVLISYGVGASAWHAGARAVAIWYEFGLWWPRGGWQDKTASKPRWLVVKEMAGHFRFHRLMFTRTAYYGHGIHHPPTSYGVWTVTADLPHRRYLTMTGNFSKEQMATIARHILGSAAAKP